MTIEQPAELNRIVLPPLSERRQRKHALLLPLLAYIAICGALASLGADWKHGMPWNWSQALILATGVPVVLLALSEYSLRSTGKARQLKITEFGMEFEPKPTRHSDRLPWKAIRALEIEPVPDHPSLFRLVVRHGPRNFGWLIGIQSPEKRQAVLRCISELEKAGRVSPGLVVEFPGVAKRDPLGPAVSLWVGVFGLLLFTFGFPLAGSAISALMDEQKREEHRVRTKEEEAKLTKKLREAGAPEKDSAWWKALVRELVSGERTLSRLGVNAMLAIAGIGSILLSVGCLVGQVLWDRQALLAWRMDMQADLQPRTP